MKGKKQENLFFWLAAWAVCCFLASMIFSGRLAEQTKGYPTVGKKTE